MKGNKLVFLISVGLFVSTGCGNKSPQVWARAETPQQEAQETDPLVKHIVALPREQRWAFVDAHRDEIGKRGPGFIAHLMAILPPRK